MATLFDDHITYQTKVSLLQYSSKWMISYKKIFLKENTKKLQMLYMYINE